MPWGRAWALGAALAALVLVGLEVAWRRAGHAPGMAAREALWCLHRERLEGADARTIALVGSSRIQMGIDQNVLRAEAPGCEPVQLAIAGAGPLPALRDLAEDESFAGLALVSVNAVTLHPRYRDGQAPLVRYYRDEWGPGRALALRLGLPLHERLVVLQPHLTLPRVLRTVLGERPPVVNFVRTRYDRSAVADYGAVPLEELVERRRARAVQRLQVLAPFPADEWAATIDELASCAAKVRARGGRVIFLRLTGGPWYAELEERYFPRERYWDVLAARLGEDALHADQLVTGPSHHPDGSHLDAAGARELTRALVRELAARGLIERAEDVPAETVHLARR